MKKSILLGVISLLLSACSSQDELVVEYAGPWRIDYVETYAGWHTSDPAFEMWFTKHIEYFESANFENYSKTLFASYDKANGDWIEWNDYKDWFYGTITWSEVIDCATESEVKALVEQFQSFTSSNTATSGRYDHFNARYLKIND